MVIASANVGAFVSGLRPRGNRRECGRLIGLTFAVRDLIASA
jgi:hypothetical protein